MHERLALPRTALTLTVGGTNGKGSCVALLQHLLAAAGRRVGCYTSPHLVDYNERIAVDGRPVSDDELVNAFERVEAARSGAALTYFEFGTLAALCVFAARRVDAQVLEVGLGGRLDAVNVAEPDAALVTGIGLDHTEWLGPDRESIGFEKAGIFRPDKPAIVGDPRPPVSLVDHANAIGADLWLRGRDFRVDGVREWRWRGRGLALDDLPAVDGPHQQDNAAAAFAMLESLGLEACLGRDRVAAALMHARPPARLEVRHGEPTVILDVAHNEDSAAALRRFLAEHPARGETWLVLGMMRDKAIDEIILTLAPAVDRWVAVQAGEPRALASAALARRIESLTGAPAPDAGLPLAGFHHAAEHARPADRIVVAGSFAVVGPVRAAL